MKGDNILVSQEDRLNQFAERYGDEMASDIIGHSLYENYWKEILNNSSSPQESWDIKSTNFNVRDSLYCSFNEKKNIVHGSNGIIPTDIRIFFKAFFNSERCTSSSSQNGPLSRS